MARLPAKIVRQAYQQQRQDFKRAQTSQKQREYDERLHKRQQERPTGIDLFASKLAWLIADTVPSPSLTRQIAAVVTDAEHLHQGAKAALSGALRNAAKRFADYADQLDACKADDSTARSKEAAIVTRGATGKEEPR